MVRQKNEPNKIDGRKRDSIGETWRDERNDEDKGKPIVPVQQQHNDAQEEADRLLHKWEMNPEPSEEYLRIIDENRYMMKISEKASNKSNARFWFNVKKIEDKYARRDPDKEIIYDFKMKKVFVSKAITDEEALKQMQKLTEMPEFGESVLSCFDSSTQEDDSPAQKRVNRQRGALNKIFEMQYESCPLALLPKEPTLQLPPPPVLLPVEGVPTERETRKRTITITGAASEVLRIISSTNNIFALFSNEKPALTGDATVEKKNEAEPTVEKNVEKLDANHMKCVKEELIDFPVNSMMNNADLTNRRSSRRKTIDNAFNDESMQIVKRKPKDFVNKIPILLLPTTMSRTKRWRDGNYDLHFSESSLNLETGGTIMDSWDYGSILWVATGERCLGFEVESAGIIECACAAPQLAVDNFRKFVK